MRGSTGSWKVLPIAACLLAMCGCGSDAGGGEEVELQVGNGIANDEDRHLTVRVTTPRETDRNPLIYGDSSNPANWTKFHLVLKDGDLVEIALEASGGQEMSKGTCTVGGDRKPGDALTAFIAVVRFFNNEYVECGTGFERKPGT